MGDTPTTAEVRECFEMSGEGLDFKRVATERGEAFDRWLATRDAEVERLTSQLREAQATIAEAKREAELWPGSDVEAQAGAALQRVSIALSRADTSAPDAAIQAAKAEGWDECLDAIDEHELNTDQARAGNPYRASIEQTEANRG